MKRIGILAHSAEGAALCFLAACHEGERRLGAYFHPDIVLDIEAMGSSMGDWEKKNLSPIAARLANSVQRLGAAGAAFFVCPDNTAHMALESMRERLALPGLHIAEVVADEAVRRGFRKIGITGTLWTMDGPVYPGALVRRNLSWATPSVADRALVQSIIFDELVLGKIVASSRDRFAEIVSGLKEQGCDAVVLGCTELPMLLDDASSPLPVLDSTRLLAREAVAVALDERSLPSWRGGPLG